MAAKTELPRPTAPDSGYRQDGVFDLRQLVDGGRSGLWEWDVVKDVVIFSPHLCTLVGLTEGRAARAVWQSLVQPGDWPAIQAAMAPVLARESAGNRFALSHGVQRADDQVQWVTNTALVTQRSAKGEAQRLTGIITDVTEQRLVEQHLKQSLLRLRLSEQAANVGSWYWEMPTGKHIWSEGLYELFGLPTTTEAGFPTWQSVVHPDDYPVALADLNRAIAEHQLANLLYRVIRPDGEHRWIRAVGVSQYDPEAQPFLMTGICIDVTAKQKSQQALEASEERNRLVIQAADIGTWDWNLITGEVIGSPRTLSILGLPPESEFSYEIFRARVHPDDRDRIDRAVKAAIEQHDDYHVEMRLIWPDGSNHWLHARGCVYYDSAGQPVRMAGANFDITERKRTERLVRDSEQRYGLVALWDWNIATGEDYMSPRLKELLGYAVDELPNVVESFYEILHPDDRSAVDTALKLHLEGCQPYSIELRMRHKDGSYRWVLSRGEALRDETGRAYRMVGAIADITERRKIEEALQESEKQHRSLIENMTDGFMLGELIYDADGEPCDFRSLLANSAMERQTGLNKTEVASRTAREIVPHLKAATCRAFHHVVTTGEPVHFENYSDDLGRYFECRVYRPAPGQFATIYRDITARKHDEQALRQLNEDLERRVAERTAALSASEEQLATILKTASDAIIIMDEAGVIKSVNLAAEKMFGHTAADMIEKDLSMFIPPAQREPHQQHLTQYLRTGERLAQRKDGTTFPVDLAVSHIEQLHLITGIIRDITPRKELERDVVNIAIMEQQRIGHYLHDECGQELTALGLLTDSLAELLKKQAPSDVHLATKISGSVHRVLQRLRGIARGLVQIQLSAANLPAALANLAASLSDSTEVRVKCDIAGPVIELDDQQATHLYHIAQEACTNALRHGRPKEIQIRFFAEPGRLVLEVQDNGRGFIDPLREGLGIRIMRHRANMIRGHLAIERKKQKKTVVTCHLPRGSPDAPPA